MGVRTRSWLRTRLYSKYLKFYLVKIKGNKVFLSQFSCQILPRLETQQLCWQDGLEHLKHAVKDKSLSTCCMAMCALSDLVLLLESSQGCLGFPLLLKKPQDLHLAYFEHWFKT